MRGFTQTPSQGKIFTNKHVYSTVVPNDFSDDISFNGQKSKHAFEKRNQSVMSTLRDQTEEDNTSQIKEAVKSKYHSY